MRSAVIDTRPTIVFPSTNERQNSTQNDQTMLALAGEI